MIEDAHPAAAMMSAKASVLIVDDSEVNRELLNSFLCETYRLYFAASGDEAIRVAEQEQPDLILLDVIMPDPDGYETCRQLQANSATQGIPVIFVTSRDRREDEEQGLAAGAVDYITKPFSPAIVRLRVANHIELKRQRDFLLSLSQLDGLTGIANRRAFDTSLERLWHLHARQRLPLSLALIDVDHFKLFNDTYGHSAGDDCLKEIASTLAESLPRSQDMAARYGGEEFAVIMPDTAEAGALGVAQRILERVRGLQIPHSQSPSGAHVSVSIGLASCVPASDGDPLDLVRCADSALYASKDKGRDMITNQEMN